ncbi:hypothetical protein Q1695_016144 [Nippostrongylus brasiliensis]|nr:hypothetical protein Q1695_016144 [Nippostrongylus brasiliensis]
MSHQEKQKNFQEQINRRVLVNWVRITGYQSKRKGLDSILEELSNEVLGYPKDQGKAFSWPAPAGVSDGVPAYRAQVSYEFWKYFIRFGRRKLFEYNEKNSAMIRLTKEKTLTLQEQDRLGLFLRKKLKQAYLNAKIRAPEISLVKGLLKIGDEVPQRPAVLAVKLNVDLSEWNGSALEDLLTNSEKEAIKAGQLRYGSMQLQGISIEKPKTSEILSATEVHLKETETCPTESQSQKRKRTLEEFMDVQVAKKHVRED